MSNSKQINIYINDVVVGIIQQMKHFDFGSFVATRIALYNGTSIEQLKNSTFKVHDEITDKTYVDCFVVNHGTNCSTPKITVVESVAFIYSSLIKDDTIYTLEFHKEKVL